MPQRNMDASRPASKDATTHARDLVLTGEKTAPARLRAIPTWPMSNHELHWIANYIWGIADDVLRDLYVRGEYRDVVLPMTVLRRLDAVLEGSKQEVPAMKARLDQAGLIEQDQALRQAVGQAFYNTSPFTLRDLRSARPATAIDGFTTWRSRRLPGGGP